MSQGIILEIGDDDLRLFFLLHQHSAGQDLRRAWTVPHRMISQLQKKSRIHR